MGEDATARLIYLVLLLLAVGGWVFVEYRGRLGAALRGFLAWGLIFVGVAAAWGIWQDMRTTLLPVQSQGTAGEIVLPRHRDGHYHLTLTVDGTPVDFLVDTGATNVVLSHADARRLGIDPDTLAYLGTARTANGEVRTARVTLTNVALGDIRDARMAAYVTNGDLTGSLLGMDYLGQFRMEFAGGKLILRQ